MEEELEMPQLKTGFIIPPPATPVDANAKIRISRGCETNCAYAPGLNEYGTYDDFDDVAEQIPHQKIFFGWVRLKKEFAHDGIPLISPLNEKEPNEESFLKLKDFCEKNREKIDYCNFGVHYLICTAEDLHAFVVKKYAKINAEGTENLRLKNVKIAEKITKYTDALAQAKKENREVEIEKIGSYDADNGGDEERGIVFRHVYALPAGKLVVRESANY
jgi:hypothetical protein